MIRGPLALTALCVVLPTSLRRAPDSEPTLHDRAGSVVVRGADSSLLKRYCVRCHGPDEQEGDVRLDTLETLADIDRADLLERMREMVAFREMPPEDEDQPTSDEIEQLEAWIDAQSESAGGAALREKLRLPHNGNLVDHDKLFGEKSPGPASSPSRRWLVSPQIFHERIMDVFHLEGRSRENMQRRSFHGVTNPFLLNDHSGVRYYDTDALDGGDLLVMIGNAAWIADRQIIVARMLGGEKQIEFPDQRDRWTPRPLPKSYQAFTAILTSEGPPNRELLEAAVDEQFDCVLRRDPTETERLEHVDLLREAIRLGDPRSGLRQMLVAVLLNSEFVYRLEFGAGDADQHGRLTLAPQEAAQAISYALGDRRPDPALLTAAAEGKLRTREDFEREVRRLLADETHYRGPIDPSLDGKHYKSNVTSHPRLVRFFREFFGYPSATKVFKDPPRAEGLYRNPHRGTNATPGRLIHETDRMVTRIVEADRAVFETLLTSDEFFVYHDRENAKGAEIIEQWRSMYERLKDSPWRTEPEQVLEEQLEFLKTLPVLRIKDASKPGELVNFMHYFEESFGKGRTPFTTVPWAHGYTFHHAPFYNLPRTPSIGRYGSWKSTKYKADIAVREFWDYPTEQPFRIPNRKGILTHPSWLVAHSTNFFSDPIRRGRWIREKLLAGRVPDVPITVDAKVPEHPGKTFRQRVEEVTEPQECWRCHQHMNPLGLPFEAFDDFGRHRSEEVLEHPDNLIKRGNGKTTFDEYPSAPVRTTGALDGTGDPKLDGEVDGPFELIERLARSDRVRQSILRHAFRFFMGRNETLADAATLRDAERAYLDSGGSFHEVVVSLLSSDSFRYRRALDD